jgi:NTE family protein/lysophospholipid hydrolase
LEPHLLAEIAEEIEWCHVHGGGILFRQGDDGDALYMVVSGRLRVILERPDGGGIVRTLREVTRGETVGELALIVGEPRSATVVALRDTELGKISSQAFTRLLEREPRSVLGVTRMLGRWLTHPAAPRSGSAATVTLVPLGRQSPLPEFARNLYASLSKLGKTLHLNSASVDRVLGAGTSQLGDRDAAYPGITRWLNDQEAEYRFILYQADAEYTPWTVRCISQADRILQVGDAADLDEPDSVFGPRGSAASIGGAADQELVLVHQSGPPVNSARWLSRGSFTTHHHVRADRISDFDRLARHLGGEAVALVLGGGGARGFAHIGVIKALEELGIPIDRLGGTSMGAVIAAQYAAGMSPAEMVYLNRSGWVGLRPHGDFTLPIISILSGRAAGRMLKMMFADRTIEDLWLNYYCVSTNLSRAELVVHRHGPVRRWIRASISLPGSAPPLIDRGDLLIDGGVLDNVPVGVMREMGESAIIVVDVSPDVDLVVDTSLKLAPTPWMILRDRFRKKRRSGGFPSLFQILYRTSVLASIKSGKERREGVAAYLEPPTSGFDIFEMDAIEAIVEVGYRYTLDQFAAGAFRLPARSP